MLLSYPSSQDRFFLVMSVKSRAQPAASIPRSSPPPRGMQNCICLGFWRPKTFKLLRLPQRLLFLRRKQRSIAPLLSHHRKRIRKWSTHTAARRGWKNMIQWKPTTPVLNTSISPSCDRSRKSAQWAAGVSCSSPTHPARKRKGHVTRIRHGCEKGLSLENPWRIMVHGNPEGLLSLSLSLF